MWSNNRKLTVLKFLFFLISNLFRKLGNLCKIALGFPVDPDENKIRPAVLLPIFLNNFFFFIIIFIF